MVLAAHADWSVDGRKRWLAVARPQTGGGWSVSVRPVGTVGTLVARLRDEAGGEAVALGADFPLGLPRDYAALHAGAAADFPSFLATIGSRPMFLLPADTIEEAGPGRPFYPRRPRAGMTRLSLARALGLADVAGLSRRADRATALRPAGAPLFWTLGANQSGKAAIAAWGDLVLPSLGTAGAPRLWPFAGPFLPLLEPGSVALAECYPADAVGQLGLRFRGSKRRQADRVAFVPGLAGRMAALGAVADPALVRLMGEGFGADAAGEDRMDCLLGVLCVLLVLRGERPDHVPPGDPALTRWEGWVLGQG